MGERREVGPVQRGHAARFIPSNTFQQHFTTQHARGRTQAMAETLMHLAYVKSSGFVSSRFMPLSFAGAKFQDFKGKIDHAVMAHRAIMSVNIGGKNIAEFADIRTQPKLRNLLIAPQARTDPLIVVDNYADRLLEIVATPRVSTLYQRVFDAQTPNQPVEMNLIIDATFQLMRILDQSYEQAVEKHRKNLAKRGYVEAKIGASGPKIAASNITAFGRQQIVEDEQFFDDLLGLGPQSPIVASRIQELKFELFKGNPTDLIYEPEVFLDLSREEARNAAPTTAERYQIEKACDELDGAARGSTAAGP